MLGSDRGPHCSPADDRFGSEAVAATHVRFGSEADMCGAKRHVRFTPKATEIADINEWQSISALPLQGSNVDLLRYCKGIIHIDAEIPDSALNLSVAEQKLHGSQIPGAAVDERRFGSPQ